MFKILVIDTYCGRGVNAVSVSMCMEVIDFSSKELADIALEILLSSNLNQVIPLYANAVISNTETKEENNV